MSFDVHFGCVCPIRDRFVCSVISQTCVKGSESILEGIEGQRRKFYENRHILTSVICMSFSFIGSIASCFGVSCGSVAFSLHFNEVS